jgi:nitrilase
MKTDGTPVMGAPIHGSSAIIAPDGKVLVDGKKYSSDELLIADLDMALVIKSKTFADPVGHYSRPDMLWLGVDRGTKAVVREH